VYERTPRLWARAFRDFYARYLPTRLEPSGEREIVITDLTYMKAPDMVCIAGIDPSNRCIRPVLPTGVRLRHLYVSGKLAVRPRAQIKLRARSIPVRPPHIEDMALEVNSITFVRSLTDAEWEGTLKATSRASVESMFDGLLKEHRRVEPGANTRSPLIRGQSSGEASRLDLGPVLG